MRTIVLTIISSTLLLACVSKTHSKSKGTPDKAPPGEVTYLCRDSNGDGGTFVSLGFANPKIPSAGLFIIENPQGGEWDYAVLKGYSDDNSRLVIEHGERTERAAFFVSLDKKNDKEYASFFIFNRNSTLSILEAAQSFFQRKDEDQFDFLAELRCGNVGEINVGDQTPPQAWSQDDPLPLNDYINVKFTQKMMAFISDQSSSAYRVDLLRKLDGRIDFGFALNPNGWYFSYGLSYFPSGRIIAHTPSAQNPVLPAPDTDYRAFLFSEGTKDPDAPKDRAICETALTFVVNGLNWVLQADEWQRHFSYDGRVGTCKPIWRDIINWVRPADLP